MKIQANLSVLAVAGLFAFSAAAQVPDFEVNKFDTAAEASDWARWWGAAVQTYQHDAAVDADGNANSGSLKATVVFNLASYGGDNQFALVRAFPVRDGSAYTNLSFDLRWDTDSPKRPSGTDHGFLEYGFRVNGFNQSWLGGRTIPTNGQWMHFDIPIPPTLANIGTVSGIVLKMWAGNAGNDLTGTATFWVDNVKLTAVDTDIPIPPPTLSISKPRPGLNLLASHPTEAYQRQSIRSAGTVPSWIDAFDPVTYSMTISKFPDGAHSGFQAHLFLVPAGHLPYGPDDSTIDWNAPHLIFWQIANNANGSAYARFMVKTNEPGNNTQLWGQGTLAVVGSSTPLGRWSLSISPDNSVSITTPDGNVTNFVMSAEMAAVFRDDTQRHALYSWFGAQPNGAGNIGQEAILSRIEITQDLVDIDEQFPGPALDTTRWAVSAYNAPGVLVVPADATAWVKWTLPDVNFTLQQSEDLTTWTPTTLTASQIIDHKRVLVTRLNPGFPKAFFRMEKPAAP
jgi:hypothetical protein